MTGIITLAEGKKHPCGRSSISERLYDKNGLSPAITQRERTIPKIVGPFIQNIPHGYNKGWQKPYPNLRASATEYNELLVKDNTVRRLTPVECERLQGFPDNWTKYGLNKKMHYQYISKTQRYKCLGNAMTVNVIEFLGRQLQQCFN